MADYNIRHRHRMKNKMIKNISNQVFEIYSLKIDLSKSVVDSATANNFDVIIVDNEVLFFIMEELPYFTIKGLLKFKPNRLFVTVDMGAVRFVANGADVMAPGIVDADLDINIDDMVWIRDENNYQPLATGRALMTGRDMVSNKSDKAIKSIHYVNDKLWKVQF